MKGNYSDSKFFKFYPTLYKSSFFGSESYKPEDIRILFESIKNKEDIFKQEKSHKLTILFDGLDLLINAKNNPLKVLDYELGHLCEEGSFEFIGLSNYPLDEKIICKSLIIYVKDIEQHLDELKKFSYLIAESICPNLKNDKIFHVLSNTYFQYKRYLQFISELIVYKQYVKRYHKKPNNKNDKMCFIEIKQQKEFIDLFKKENRFRKDFHGINDFYNLIKGIADEFGKSSNYKDSEKNLIIIKHIERNFGGINYKIDIDFNLVLEDIKENIKLIENILSDNENFEENEVTKVTSVYLFKKIYNLECDKVAPNLKIDLNKINEYNINECINDNIRDNNSRYLLIEVNHSLRDLIIQSIKLQNPLKEVKIYEGSPFPNDNSSEYRFEKIRLIQEDAKDDKLIIINHLEQIHPFLYDLYSKDYQIIGGKKYCKIKLNNFNDEYTFECNDNLKFIILVDKRVTDYYVLSFLNRFEKMIINFDDLLDNKINSIADKIIEKMGLKKNILENKNLSLINCEKDSIKKLAYFYSLKENYNKDENQLREKVIDKIYKMLPKDIKIFFERTSLN